MLRPVDWDGLNTRIVACERCPRLVAWTREVARAKRKSFSQDEYWGKPVPNFGDPHATGLVVGLAPAAHGANRTGRMFTGDRSGDWLFRAFHRAGLASQPDSTVADDGLALRGVMVTACAHCAPPGNKPTEDELASCRGFLSEALAATPWKSVLCLGGMAWKEAHRGLDVKSRPFGHGAAHQVGQTHVIGCYHPSQQNTFTGRLTEAMLDDVVGQFAAALRL